MGTDKEYVIKVCKVHEDKGVEFITNYIFEHPVDDNTLPCVKEEPGMEIEEEVEVIDDGGRNYRVLGGVVHLGKSIHVGHYVAFARRVINNKEEWCYFNDEKVYISELPKIGQSYVFILEKK